MNFANFQIWRNQCLHANPDLLDGGETNLYRTLDALHPRLDESDHSVYRCDLARAWLGRYGFPTSESRRALISRGVRHALTLIFQELARTGAGLWIPADVYPAYLELAQAAGIVPRCFTTLPETKLPSLPFNGGTEYLLLANPWKPLGRYLTAQECDELVAWLEKAPRRYLLLDCVYDFGAPFHATTQRLQSTGRAMLLHSATKGWLWPKTFGVVLLGESHPQLEAAFRNDSPSPEQLRLGERFLSTESDCPNKVVSALQHRGNKMLDILPASVRSLLLIEPGKLAPGSYFFPVKASADELLSQNRILAIPARVFGADWQGCILSSLSPGFAPINILA